MFYKDHSGHCVEKRNRTPVRKATTIIQVRDDECSHKGSHGDISEVVRF